MSQTPNDNAAHYLVHCAGRASMSRAVCGLAAAKAKAKELAAQFPGHEFIVYAAISCHEVTKPGSQAKPLHFGNQARA